MPVHRDFAVHMGKRALLGTDDPWQSWHLVPLATPAAAIAFDALYADVEPVFASVSTGNWSIQTYVPNDDPQLDVLPYAFLAGPPSWTNTGAAPVTIRSVAVIAFNPDTQRDELLFWEAVAPEVTLLPGDTFRPSVGFSLSEVLDG